MNWHQVLEETRAWAAPLLWRAPAALAVLGLGLFVAWTINRFTSRLLNRYRLGRKRTAYPALISLGILLVTAALTLLTLGIPASVIGFVVTSAVALGLLSDSLGGVRILLLQPFRYGDLIEIQGEKITGFVEAITLSGTFIKTSDGAQIFVPNRLLFEHPIVNHSAGGAWKKLSFEFVVEFPGGVDDLKSKLSTLVAASQSGEPGYESEILVSRIETEKITLKVHFAVSPYTSARVASDFLKAADACLRENAVTIHSLSVLNS